MTLRWLPLDALAPHPENANRMLPDLFEKLKGHIARTGLYEPLVVRPMARQAIEAGEDTRGLTPAARESARRRSSRPRKRAGRGATRYQILNGHHRARVLRELGQKRARCDVWDVDDEEARLLLATLNRLEGRDDPKARARLVAALAAGRNAEDLARLLPEPPDAVERLLRLAEPPPEPAPPDSLEPLPEALIFFLSAEQHALVSEALKEVQNAECRAQNAEQKVNGGAREVVGGERDRDQRSRLERRESFEPPALRAATFPAAERSRAMPCMTAGKARGSNDMRRKREASGGGSKRLGRAERLERLALWYLESVGRR